MADQKYDINKIAPGSTMALSNLRSNPESIHQGDFQFLRPLTYLLIDNFEYSSDTAAQTAWEDGTGEEEVTITSEPSVVAFGNYSLKVVVDPSPADEIIIIMNQLNTAEISDLSLMRTGQIYLRTTKTGGDTVKLNIIDSSGNISYWNLVISAANDWQAVSFDLTTPDGNNGSNADLSDVQGIYFDSLSAGETYYFDDFRLFVGNTVIVDGRSYLTGYSPYHAHVWGFTGYGEIDHIFIDREIAPEITLPTTAARTDLLVYNPQHTPKLQWITGTEGTTIMPSPENHHIPICYVRVKTTQSKIVELWEAASNPNEGYIATDCRNFIYPFLLNQLGYNAQVVSKVAGNGYVIRISAIQTGGTRKDVAEFSYKGLQFIADQAYSGSWLNKFSTDATLVGNDDHTAVSEKAIKTYVDSLIPKHFISPGKISMSGNSVVVEPRVLLLEGVMLKESGDISKDVTVSGNYVGTDMSATEGYVYVYLKDDGSGGYDVYLSGDAPNRSDCSAGATAGNLIYREFSSTWYTCIGVRYKSATALKSFYVSDDGLVMFEDFIEVVNAGSGSIDADYDSKLPSVINLGLFSAELATAAGDWPECKIRPKGSSGDYLFFTASAAVAKIGGGQIWCHAGTDNQIRVVIDKSTSSTAKLKLVGYKDIRV